MIEVKLDAAPVIVVFTPVNHALYVAVDEALHQIGDGYHGMLTSGCENIHSESSAHYYNEALDFRIVWPAAFEEDFLKALAVKLALIPKKFHRETFARGYRYVREPNHLHVERIR
jgi:hypothetical protein